jgi:hypothetical protein
MHTDYPPPRETIRERLERDLHAIQEALADPILDELNTDDLVLERLPNGEHAWLRPEDVRYRLTDSARCPACGQAQDTPSCAQREHWGVA